MSGIFEFTLKGIKKKQTESNFECSLYFQDKKIGKVISNKEFSFLWEKKHIDNIDFQNKIYDEINEYYNIYPKYIDEKTNEGMLKEFIRDLLLLNEIEKIFKKENSKEQITVLRLLFYDDTQKTDIENKKEQILTCKNWSTSLTEDLINMYKPIKVYTYETIEDLHIRQ